MNEALVPVLAVFICIVVAAGTTALLLHLRGKLVRLEEAWASFASPRGYEFARHGGLAWLGIGMGQSPRIRGAAAGVPFEIELSGSTRDWTDTSVSAQISMPPDAPPGAEVPDDAMDPAAREAWTWLRAQRARAGLRVWPAGTRELPRRPGHRVIVAWAGRERDAVTLDVAIRLVVALVLRRPSRLGPGVKYVPWYMRR